MHAGNIDFLRRPGNSRPPHRGLVNRPAALRAPYPLGVLIFDSKGLIRFCSTTLADLLGASANDLAGRCVREFLPALPFDPATEGYNVAFGTFYSTKRCLQSWRMKTGRGGTVQVDGYFASLSTEDGYRFCLQLQLRNADSATDDAIDGAHAASGHAGTAAGRIALAEETRQYSRHSPSLSGESNRRWRREWLSSSRAIHAAPPDMQPRPVQLLFDREYRISFASSSIEDLLAHDYERVTGMHVSDLLPDFPSRLGAIRTIGDAMARLRSMGSILVHALHASGTKVPVVVALREKKHMHLISLLISAAEA